MNLFGNRQRLCFGGWILTGLIIAAFNVLNYITLASQPLEGRSHLLKSVSLKLSRLGSTTARNMADANGLQPTGFFFKRYFQNEEKQPPLTAQPEKESQLNHPVEVELPTLSGIAQIIDHQGVFHYWAILNGNVCKEKDQTMGYRVGKITAQGVVLHKSGQRRFIKCPVVYYSDDQGK